MTALLVDRSAMADFAQAAATSAEVCIRPLVRQVIDRVTGHSQMIPIPCGSTRESKCPSCAAKARRLRMHQCREGWHRETEPEFAVGGDGFDTPEESGDNPLTCDDTEDGSGSGAGDDAARTTRSTLRIDGFPDLPRVPVDQMQDRTTGQTFTDDKTGHRFRPSMFITLTLPSYGRVFEGAPVDPSTYDYRRAALDALVFS